MDLGTRVAHPSRVAVWATRTPDAPLRLHNYKSASPWPLCSVKTQPMQSTAYDAVVMGGELEGGWQMRWRMRVFFFLVKVQGRWPFLPRISFD